MNDFDNKQICSYKDIDRFGFTCDVCGRKVNGCHYINGMSFCEKCYQETFGKDNQQNENNQLKQRLAEKDKEIAHLKEMDNYHLQYELAGADETIANLRQQLDEKDREIERLKNLFKLNNEVVINQGREIFDLRVQVLQQKQNQTQLAIQELEEMWALLLSKAIEVVGTGVDCVRLYTINEVFSQKIKELKGE